MSNATARSKYRFFVSNESWNNDNPLMPLEDNGLTCTALRYNFNVLALMLCTSTPATLFAAWYRAKRVSPNRANKTSSSGASSNATSKNRSDSSMRFASYARRPSEKKKVSFAYCMAVNDCDALPGVPSWRPSRETVARKMCSISPMSMATSDASSKISAGTAGNCKHDNSEEALVPPTSCRDEGDAAEDIWLEFLTQELLMSVTSTSRNRDLMASTSAGMRYGNGTCAGIRRIRSRRRALHS
mmetsp:Transcript_101440/g.286160  ORF Transcript_101440/g.286160 Transcript_101440/m.286160 type:complete len:243 (+) Transcript_101440:383-1111(+)